MKTFFKEIKSCSKALKGDRKKFWEKNKKNFEKNIRRIIKNQKLPRGWKIYLVVSGILSDKKIWPFDNNSWSSTSVIGATKKQGFEIMMFFNRAGGEFLSAPALMPLVVHELQHIKQIAKSPKNYIISVMNDKISIDLEKEAEKDVKNLPKEIKEEAALEKILYCYDLGGWKMAEKMANFMYKKREKVYGGGYLKEMTKQEYEAFQKAKKNKNIHIFIDFF